MLASLSAAEEKLAKARKENALLAANLSLSRDRHERRIDYLKHSKDVACRNLMRRVRRETIEEAQVLMNNYLLANSLPAANLGSGEIGQDEVPRAKDNDYHYESGDETLDEEGNIRDRNGNIIASIEYEAEPSADKSGEAIQDKTGPAIGEETQGEETQGEDNNAEKSASGLIANNTGGAANDENVES